jgi:hypothetical protein
LEADRLEEVVRLKADRLEEAHCLEADRLEADRLEADRLEAADAEPWTHTELRKIDYGPLQIVLDFYHDI